MLKIGIAIVSILLVTGCTTAATTSSLKEDAEPTLQKMQRKMRGKTVEYCVTRGGHSECTYMSEDQVRNRLRNLNLGIGY
tara:strand:+ start:1183 stop:1422 length:240 start_codon:yes stop_codon:yes gene_type:complete